MTPDDFKEIRKSATEFLSTTTPLIMAPGVVLAILDAAAPSAAEGWHPIRSLPPRNRVILGRWDKVGNTGKASDWMWQQAEGHWFHRLGEVHWSWGDQNPFFMRQLPTHYHTLIEPPPRPEV
jgi:hypothetical protein